MAEATANTPDDPPPDDPIHPAAHWATTVALLALGLLYYSMFFFFLIFSLTLVAVLYPTCLVIGWAAGRASEGWRFLRGDRVGGLSLSEDHP